VALTATSLVGAHPASGAPARLAVTGGCRAVGSADAPTGGGPDRATVVVDTGSGAVWSACVSFSGSISGIEALERAEAVITDLDPVYDQYSGLGKAVCKLRDVGTAPPDCLGKSANSWWLSINGKVSAKGASSIAIKDGDVEGWKYGTGGTPRAATEGTEAAAAPPPTTTTKPPTPTVPPTQPPVATTKPGGGAMTGSTKPDGTPADPTTTRPGQTTTTVKGQTTTTAKGATTTSTTKADGEGRTTKLAGTDETDDDASGGGRTESASGATSSSSSATGDDSSGSSSLPAVLGFAAVIAAIAGGTLLIRRRRLPTP
jgi:hypothetical protein